MDNTGTEKSVQCKKEQISQQLAGIQNPEERNQNKK